MRGQTTKYTSAAMDGTMTSTKNVTLSQLIRRWWLAVQVRARMAGTYAQGGWGSRVKVGFLLMGLVGLVGCASAWVGNSPEEIKHRKQMERTSNVERRTSNSQPL